MIITDVNINDKEKFPPMTEEERQKCREIVKKYKHMGGVEFADSTIHQKSKTAHMFNS